MSAPFAAPHVRLDELLLSALRRDPQAVAVIDGATGAALTRGELAAAVEGAAAGFAAAGLGAGDVIAVQLRNGIEFPVVFLGACRCGATVTPVPASASAAEVARQVDLTGAAAFVGAGDLAPLWSAAVTELEPERVVVVGEAAGEFTSYEALLSTDHLEPEADVDPATHPAALPMSSGTTGLPKPVILTHRALVANTLQFETALGLRRGGAVLAFLPFSHIYGLTTSLFAALVGGQSVVTMPRFAPDAMARLVAEHRITTAFIVPPVAGLLAGDAVPAEPLGSLRLLVSGAAPLDPRVGRAVEARLGVEIVQGYGLTELAPVTHVMRPGAGMPLASIGTALDGVETRVVAVGADGTDPAALQDAEVGAVGELWARGPNAFSGYLGDPEATAAMLLPDGWVRTGDLVTQDADGHVVVVDRLKEVLKNRGFQVSPAELEALLAAHPGVADVAITGVVGRDPGDEEPYALVVPRLDVTGVAPDAAELRAHVAARVSRPKHLAGVAFVDALPRSDAGKLLRRRLPELLPDGVTPSRPGR